MQDKGYSNDWLEMLKAKNDIVSTISSYIKLQKKGKSYWGCCPFHHERTPSFCVNEYDGFFHCFGCGESGDVISFLQKYEGIDFVDAVKILAEKADMKVPAFTGDKEIAERKKQKEKMLEVLRESKDFYKNSLLLPSAKPAQEYVKKRKLTGKEVKNFELGFSPGWTNLVAHLKSKGFSLADMICAGVVESKNGREFDVFANRLVFPILNSFGDCIGFSARILEKSDFAKYKNSSQNLLFDKSKIVYGINLVKKQKVEKGLKNIIIVEGQMDVIAMHRAGFENTVACMGTAITSQHAKELKRFSDEVVLCLDADEAGQKAALRAIDILSEGGLEVFVASLEGGKDPDEVLSNKGSEFLKSIIEKALPATDYRLKVIADKYDLSKPDQKTKYLKQALEVVSALGSNSQKDAYLEVVKQKTNIPIDILRKDLSGNGSNVKNAPDALKEQSQTREDATIKAMQFVVASHLFSQPWADYDKEITDCIKNRTIKQLYQTICQRHQDGQKLQVSSIFDMFDVDNEYQIKQILSYNFASVGERNEKYYQDCKNLMKTALLKEQQQHAVERFKAETDPEKRKQITIEISQILSKLKNKKM